MSSVCSVEQRQCTSCRGVMLERGFRRTFFRYISVFRCRNCQRLLTQETRGFQGFYIGLLSTFITLVIYGCTKADKLHFIECVMLGLVFLAGIMPVLSNVIQYYRSPVISRGYSSEFFFAESDRGYIARTLSGTNWVPGFIIGVFGAVAGIFLIGMGLLVLSAFLG